MTQESNAALLQAYKYATEADQDGIADLLETVILELMGSGNQSPIILGDSRTTTDQPWKISCGPDIVTLGGTMECTGIDHLSKETKA
jgi:hypothetical protein